jgi:O-antigen/teichoic acid export membrane protein
VTGRSSQVNRTQGSSPEEAPAFRGRNIVRGLGSLTLFSALSAILGFVQFTVLVRFLAQPIYGAYASVQVSVSIASVVAGVGLGSAVVRYLAPSSEPTGSGWGPAKAATYLTLVFSGAASLLFAAVAPYLSDYFLKSPSDAWVFYLGALWVFTTAIDNPVLAMLQAMRRYNRYSALLIVSRFVSVSAAVVGVIIYQSLAIALVSNALYAALATSAALPSVIGPLRKASAKGNYMTVLRYGFPLGVAGIVSVVASNADIVVVGGYLSPSDLAVYNATVAISSVLSSFFVVPLVTALFAETSFSAARSEEVAKGTGLAVRFVMVTLLPASFFAAALAPQLFGLFSGKEAYYQGIPYLELITLFYVFYAIQTLAIYVLQGVGKTRQVLIVGGLTAVGEVALSASLIPVFGLEGAALSRVGMFVAGSLLSLYFIRDHLLGPANYRFMGKALVSAVIPAVGVYLPSVMISDRVLTLIPYTVLGLALFVVCAKLSRLLSQEDKSYLGHLLPSGFHWVLRLL